jgi:quercetin dioxygenase-like cupin family protein
MSFFDPTQREAKELAPGIVARTFWGERMLVAVVDLAPDALLPLHNHVHEQVGMILSGQLELTIDTETKLLQTGDVYVIPSNVPHTARAGSDGTKVVDVFSPVREEYRY